MRVLKTLSALALLSGGVAAQTAEATLFAARIGAVDVPAVAKFYQSVFGLHEVNRLALGADTEIMLNFGATLEAAKANSNAQIVVLSRKPDAVASPMAHMIFQVQDIAAVAKKVTTAGGKLVGEPQSFGDSGISFLFALDPAGNTFELIYFPPAK
jgi:predicted enzyme related to lactoylglutathione lyase